MALITLTDDKISKISPEALHQGELVICIFLDLSTPWIMAFFTELCYVQDISLKSFDKYYLIKCTL